MPVTYKPIIRSISIFHDRLNRFYCTHSFPQEAEHTAQLLVTGFLVATGTGYRDTILSKMTRREFSNFNYTS